MLKSVELKREKAGVWEGMKALHKRAEEEGRELKAEEEES